MYYYIYKIQCYYGSYKGHYYIGQHRTDDMNDGYIGSGTQLHNYLKKYGAKEGDTYTKEILCFCSSLDDLNKAEYDFIGDKYDTDPLCMNLRAGGGQAGYSKEILEKMRCPKPKISELRKIKKWDCHTPEGNRKISLALKGKSKSEEHKQKLSESAKKQWSNPEQKQFIIESNIRRTGQKWINDGKVEKLVWPEEIPIYLELGWQTGRRKNINNVA